MRSGRSLVILGVVLIALSGGSVFTGFSSFGPWAVLTIAGLVGGVISLVVGLVRSRHDEALPPHDSARADRLIRIAGIGLTALALVALIVALVVATGEARDHAFGHLIIGIAVLALFAALALPWHPAAGSSAAMLRGVVLVLLALGTFGSFVESLGGAGYDAANAERRIASLAVLHDVGLVFGVFIIAAPLGVLTGAIVAIGWATRRLRAHSV